MRLARDGKRSSAEYEAANMESMDLMESMLDEFGRSDVVYGYGDVEAVLSAVEDHLENEGDHWHLSPYPRRAISLLRETVRDLLDAEEPA